MYLIDQPIKYAKISENRHFAATFSRFGSNRYFYKTLRFSNEFNANFKSSHPKRLVFIHFYFHFVQLLSYVFFVEKVILFSNFSNFTIKKKSNLSVDFAFLIKRQRKNKILFFPNYRLVLFYFLE